MVYLMEESWGGNGILPQPPAAQLYSAKRVQMVRRHQDSTVRRARLTSATPEAPLVLILATLIRTACPDTRVGAAVCALRHQPSTVIRAHPTSATPEAPLVLILAALIRTA